MTISHPTEEQEQNRVISWALDMEAAEPDLVMLHSVPNEGPGNNVARGARMKAMGRKRGVPDLHLPAPRGDYHGLWIEMKRVKPKGKLSPDQQRWITRLNSKGYLAVVAYGADEAIQYIEDYLKLDPWQNSLN